MKLLVSALEPSSNLHLASLMKHLEGKVELMGIFDSKLSTKPPLYTPDQFSVMGFLDVIERLGFFWRAKKEMAHLASEADKILLMDSSSFNIPLAKAIKKAFPSKEIIYYILPQVWAWKPWRAKAIEESCDFLAAILPFETACYQSKAEYVGHPLLDLLPPIRASLPKEERIAFMPGSRKGEIGRLFPLFREVAKRIEAPKTLVIPSIYEGASLEEIYGDLEGFELSYDAPKTLLESSFAFICSGTATLEAALLGVPLVLAYKARPLDYFIAKNLVKIEHIGLANIFETRRGEEPLHEELLQEGVNVKALLEAYWRCDKERFVERAKALRDYLGKGSSLRVAQRILEIDSKVIFNDG